MIIREKYLSQIRPFYDQDLIKVITGIRRCGKSVILSQIIEEIKQNGVNNDHIIYINFELKTFSFIKSDDDLYDYIKEKIIDNKKYYLFIDEIQIINKWELAINSLKAEYNNNISIFVTGSNSDLLSSEFATHIAGRYVSFNVFPFTFDEICLLKNIDKNNSTLLEDTFNDYLLWGGMPQRFALDDLQQEKVYLSDIFDSIVMKDIITRFNIKDVDLFNRIIEYIVTTPSQSFSAEKLEKYFESENRSVTKNTLYNYLEYMCKALLINKVERYDVRGKRILNGKYKYYLTDLGLGQIINISKKLQLGAYLENIVFNELKSRGYDVKVGTLESGEIDFIATKNDMREYYQVCYLIGDDEKIISREFNSLKALNDNYNKYVISTDKIDLSQNGIIHKNVIDWLLNI